MNAKLRKTVKIAAAGLFLAALAINVQVTLDDPFTMTNEVALAQTSTLGCGDGQTPVIRTVKNYDLTIWTFGNDDVKVDSKDCKEKECALYSENGTCTFFECVDVE